MSSETHSPASTYPPQSAGSTLRPHGPEELPPVTPPSAGYIIQLFLIPALIVAAVVAVWALFGKLADSETDWKQMVSELGSSNEHRRWRSALGLAQLLRNDELAPVAGEPALAEQPVVVDGLTGLLKSSLDSTVVEDVDIKHQEFLARTLGALRADQKVLPVLALAMSAERHADVRKSAVMSVASIAGRHFEHASGYTVQQPAGADQSPVAPAVTLPLSEPTIREPEVLKQLKLMSQDTDPLFRQLAAFTIASVSGPECVEQLKVMLLDNDANTRANAAIGLARNQSEAGLSAISELLTKASLPFDPSAGQGVTEDKLRLAQAQYEVEQQIIARNCLKAVSDLWSGLAAEPRSELRTVLQQTAEKHFAMDVRMQAAALLKTQAAE